MKFSVWPGGGQSWAKILEVASHAEKTGWDGIWFADHFMPNQAAPGDLGPTNEAWTIVAGLAAAVPRVRIGTLVTGNTYRHPAVLAKMAATADNISGGRIVLGIGSGWQENEHNAYGLEFSTVAGRLRRMEEACQVIKGLFSNERTTLNGKYYQLKDAPLSPKPVQNPLPLLIGGGGEKLTMKLAATYADEWNVWGTPETLRHKIGILEAHCEKLGRDPKSIKRSCQALVFLTDDAASVPRTPMAQAIGNVDQMQQIVGQYRDAGVDEIIVPDFSLGQGEQKLATLDRYINEVAKPFR